MVDSIAINPVSTIFGRLKIKPIAAYPITGIMDELEPSSVILGLKKSTVLLSFRKYFTPLSIGASIKINAADATKIPEPTMYACLPAVKGEMPCL